MKHVIRLALVASTLSACQLVTAVKSRTGAGPGTDTGTAAGRDRDGDRGAAPAAAPTGEGHTAAVAVKSDLCTPDPDAEFDVDLHRQELADRTTICTMIEVEPVAGVPAIAPRAPGWCDRLSKNEIATSRMISATSGMQALVEGRYWWATTREILGPLCGNPTDAAVQKQTGYLYQWWANLTGLEPEQLDGLFRYFGSFPSSDGTLYQKSMKEACKAFPEPGEEVSDRERLLSRATRSSLGCADSDGVPFWVSGVSGEDLYWHLDAAEAPPSELVRAYAVLECLGDPDAIDDGDLAAYAACGPDARALDPRALETEIAGYHELAQAHARMTVAAARRVAARYEAVAQARAKEDAAWQTLLYDAPAAGWKAWTAAYRADQAVIDAARAYEVRYTGASRKAARGCWDDAWGHFTAHVARAKADSLDGAKAAMTDTAGTILLEHVVACADAEGEAQIFTVLGQLFDRARPARGPRYAAYFAVLDALGEILLDRSKFPMEPQSLARFYRDRSPVARSGWGNITELDLAREDGGGVVKKTRREGAGVRVEFKTDRWKTSIWNCTPNLRILQYRPDGTPVYDSDCTYGGKQWVEQTHDPIWIPAAMAGGIEPGTFVRSAGSIERHGDAWDSIPVEVWADKERNKLTAYLGVELRVK